MLELGGEMKIILEHNAGGRKEREAFANQYGIWVDRGLAGRYAVTKTPSAKSFRHLKATGEGSGWYVSQEDMRVLLAAHYEARKALKKTHNRNEGP
jgi:hypothetical protein